MGTFEFDSRCDKSNSAFSNECIMANRVFDQCRVQLCLTPDMLGPARAAASTAACAEIYNEGDIIVPPCNAASVSIDNFSLYKIIIEKKTQNPFRTGYWDVNVKYIFTYRLIFTSVDGCELCSICATSAYTTKLSLFGSVCTDVVMASDLYSLSASTGPFVTAEGKAVSLSAELRFPTNNCCTNMCGCGCGCGCSNDCSCSNPCSSGCGCGDSRSECPSSVNITIGLFSVVKIFRPVNIVVPSSGYCVPEECAQSAVSGQTVCDFFDSIDFPFDIFSPPATPTAANGTACSNTTANNNSSKCGCGCK